MSSAVGPRPPHVMIEDGLRRRQDRRTSAMSAVESATMCARSTAPPIPATCAQSHRVFVPRTWPVR
ncbi:MAG: hypothetical protein QF593_10575, partial [Nitrospinota bacterium]|nr:hypothetical protein [Nitrospinota bacterium]